MFNNFLVNANFRVAAINFFSAVISLALMAWDAALASDISNTMRICDNNGCRSVPREHVASGTLNSAQKIREDSDGYRGESVGALEQLFRDGDAVAAYKLGIVNQYGVGGRKKNFQEAQKYYEFAANDGHAWAQYRLASLLHVGTGRANNDARALELFFAAAKAGHPLSANFIGLAFLQGNGLPRDPTEAVNWLTVAASAGIPEAQRNIGLVFLRGESGKRDLYQGFKWIKSASAGGDAVAQKTLGRIYMTGLDTVQQDLDEAARWLEPLADSGDKEAKLWLKDINRGREADRAYAEKMQEQSAETFRLLAGVALSAMMAPPPVYVVGY